MDWVLGVAYLNPFSIKKKCNFCQLNIEDE